MKALEKVELLKKAQEEQGYGGKYFLDLHVRDSKWSENELKKLQSMFPFLPELYINFLKQYDGGSVAWAVFFGSDGYKYGRLSEELLYWKDPMKGQYFPFGKEPDGSIYVFDRDGQVLMFPIDDYEWEHPPVFIAKNLEAFIGDCLLGERFKEFMEPGKSRFYPFLKDQGWCA